MPIDELIADPGRGGAGHPAGRRAASSASPLPRDLYGAERAQFRRARPVQRAARSPRSPTALAESAGGRLARRAVAGGGAAAGAGASRCATPPTTATSSATCVDAATAEIEAAPGARRGGRAGLGRDRRRAERAAMPRARRRRHRGSACRALIGLIVREAGKSFANAVAEVREAVDFLRYYAAAGRAHARATARHAPLGPVVCISPWNFPLAIFTGQVAAALAAGNPVLAKPAEETPLIAAEAVRLLHEAGIPADVAATSCPAPARSARRWSPMPRVQGVMFTGSTEVARLIQRQLADAARPDGQPVPLIAETGGQNAMIVDSSALAEQVVGDVIASAFDSAGQRCSALRMLCLQEEIADRTLAMLKGAMARTGGRQPRSPVDRCRPGDHRRGARQHRRPCRGDARGAATRCAELPLPDATRARHLRRADASSRSAASATSSARCSARSCTCCATGAAELDRLIEDDQRHRLRPDLRPAHAHRRDHRRASSARIEAGNIYVNRNIIGAVVGVQPFGGHGLSGTGPKAGGPLYLGRLLGIAPQAALHGLEGADAALTTARIYTDWLRSRGHTAEAERCIGYLAGSALGARVELDGPVGERNLYALRPRGAIAALAKTASGLLVQVGALLATGNVVVIDRSNPARATLDRAPAEVVSRLVVADDWRAVQHLGGVLFEGEEAALLQLNQQVAERPGPILAVQAATPAGQKAGGDYDLTRLLEECSISTNTAAAGGNASLMSIG